MAEGKVEFEVVTPVRLLVTANADMVVVPGGGGDFGVLPGHAPLLSSLRPGTVDVYENDKIREQYFVEGGFADVTAERCTLLAQEALRLADVTDARAEERLKQARDSLEAADTFEKRKAAGRELDVAEAMLTAVKRYRERTAKH